MIDLAMSLHRSKRGKRCFMKHALVLAAVVTVSTPLSSVAAITSSEAARLATAARVVQDIRSEIQGDYWTRARCVAVIPELKKAAFIVGGEFGKGVLSCRSGSAWSAPVFMQLAK